MTSASAGVQSPSHVPDKTTTTVAWISAGVTQTLG